MKLAEEVLETLMALKPRKPRKTKFGKVAKKPSNRRRTSEARPKSTASTKKLSQTTKTIRPTQNPSNKPTVFDVLANVKEQKVTVFAKTKVLDPQVLRQGKEEYFQSVTFEDVSFVEDQDSSHTLPINVKGKSGATETMFTKKLSRRNDKIKVRCSCPDFRFMWHRWDHTKEHALRGPLIPYRRKTPPPEQGGMPYRNPEEIPGLCKHLIKVFNELSTGGALTKS